MGTNENLPSKWIDKLLEAQKLYETRMKHNIFYANSIAGKHNNQVVRTMVSWAFNFILK